MDQQTNPHRKMLAIAVSSVVKESGFEYAEKEALGTLTEMMQAFLCQVGHLGRNYCELSGRVEPLIADIVLAFTEMGFNFNTLGSYLKSGKHAVLPTLQPQQPQKQLNMLSAGSKEPLPNHIPKHLPPFPDPHAYVRTPTHKQPIIDYESVREKAAMQKKDVEKALTKFLAKTSPTHNLFDTEEGNIFPLIAIKPPYPPYLSALLPQDQIFDPEDLDFDPKSQILQQQKEHKEAQNIKKEEEEEEPEGDGTEIPMNETVKSEEGTQNSTFIDNPYLAATKMPMKEQNIDIIS
ncbi:transcription initiation factor TFIID subunit 8 [Anthonomus grandis grandis]|uniref:transcription initiation factor TFIID subunit 8 n=1 Tax=Anthonomus grandis grandis TaxID=2921223 RepID=UPI0021665AD7|nr:transcription initiation factor TFIID subunit 8 [Anthonomus grandis grandis]